MSRILLCIVMLFTLTMNSINVFAKNNEKKELTGEELKNYIYEEALSWAKNVEPNKSLTVSEFININSISNNEPQYSVSYFYGTLPYGYAVISLIDNELVIKDSVICGGVEGLYTELVDVTLDKTNENYNNLKFNKQVIELAPLEYAISIEYNKNNKKILVDNYGNYFNTSESFLISDVYKSIQSIYISYENFNSNKYVVDTSTKVILKDYNINQILLRQTTAQENASCYCCGISCIYQIAYMKNLTSLSLNDIKNNYIKLWNYSNVKIYETSQNINYGSTTVLNASKGLIKFAKEKGKFYSTYEFVTNPSSNWIKTSLKNNYPILMGYNIKIADGSGYKESGHGITILGYMRAKKIESGNTWTYLMVYDTWSKTPRYINYSTVDFSEGCEAAAFKIL